MSGRVSLGGHEMELQAAINELEDQVARALTEVSVRPVVDALNATVRDALTGPTRRPIYDLVSSIPTFDGERPDTVSQWFATIDDVASLSNWEDDAKLRVAKLRIVGEAAKFIQSLDQAAVDTYAEFRRLVCERFNDKAPRHCYFLQLAAIQQKKGESTESFADRVRTLNEKTVRVTANAEVNAAFREEADRRALDAFVRGLIGPVGEHTRLKFPQTLREAIDSAIAIEYVLNTTQAASKEARPIERKVFSIDDVTCYDCNKKGHTRRFCKARGRGQGHQSNEPRNGCWACGEIGHRQRECRARRGEAVAARVLRRDQPRNPNQNTARNDRPNQVRTVPEVRYLADELIVMGQVGRMRGKILIDTGAEVSLIRRGAAAAPVRQTDLVLKGITGRTLRIYGEQRVTLSLGPNTTVSGDFVVSNLPPGYIAVMGCDLLNKGNGKIDIARGELNIYGKNVWLNRVYRGSVSLSADRSERGSVGTNHRVVQAPPSSASSTSKGRTNARRNPSYDQISTPSKPVTGHKGSASFKRAQSTLAKGTVGRVAPENSRGTRGEVARVDSERIRNRRQYEPPPPTNPYRVGQKVMLHVLSGGRQKHEPWSIAWEGPYEVRHTPYPYCVVLEVRGRRTMVHVDRVKLETSACQGKAQGPVLPAEEETSLDASPRVWRAPEWQRTEKGRAFAEVLRAAEEARSAIRSRLEREATTRGQRLTNTY